MSPSLYWIIHNTVLWSYNTASVLARFYYLFLYFMWCTLHIIFGKNLLYLGVANGKIRDSPSRRDPCLKIQDRDLKALTKSEPETLYQENRARDFILQKSEPVSKTVRSQTWQWATRYSINIRSISQEFQNVTPWRLIFDLKTRLAVPTHSKECYRTFLIK